MPIVIFIVPLLVQFQKMIGVPICFKGENFAFGIQSADEAWKITHLRPNIKNDIIGSEVVFVKFGDL